MKRRPQLILSDAFDRIQLKVKRQSAYVGHYSRPGERIAGG